MSRLNRIKTSIEKNRNFEEARRILNDSPSGRFSSENIDFVPFQSQNDRTEDNTLISRDRGNGRASSGIQFLELMALIFSGKELDSMLKFDRVPQYVSPRAFFNTTLTDTQKVNIISRSLGVEDFVDMERRNNSDFTTSIMQRFLTVFEEVTNGTFRVRDSRSLLAFCRVLVRGALNRNRGNVNA